jgi:UDP-N-acetylglucosamine:LPS N-acetylglucosamine transferase
MGAGHTGAAQELARRVRLAGSRAVVEDLLDAVPRPVAAGWVRSYALQLRFWPESYERAYALYYRPSRGWPLIIASIARTVRPRLEAWLDEAQPDVIVSTYAFATLVLGHLRETGQLGVPVCNYLTDMAVHPRSVHRGVDAHLAIHPVAAEAARALVSAPVYVAGAAVAPRFFAADPSASRRALGMDDGRPVVVVSGGSWGVGAGIEHTVATLATGLDAHFVALCGNDDRLQATLARAGTSLAVGWTPRADRYLAAADVVVENAGGLTSLEACAAGAALVSYHPIPGHGRDNVRAMVQAGFTAAPTNDTDFIAMIDQLVHDPAVGQAQRVAAAELFRYDPAERILAIAAEAGRSGITAATRNDTAAVAPPATTSST